MKDKQKLLLVQSIGDQTITVAEDQTPVITVGESNPTGQVAMVVNFLRGGSHSSQILVDRGSSDEKTKPLIKELLGQLALTGEEFSCQGEVVPGKNSVLLITRRCS